MPELFLKPPEQRFPQISVDAVNQMLRAVPRVITGDGVQLKKVGDRWIIESDEPYVYPADEVQYFVVMSEQEDYLTCVNFSFSNSVQFYDQNLGNVLQAAGLTGTVVYVAKPYWLQQAPFQSKTVFLNGSNVLLKYTGIGIRTYDNGVDSPITQRIVPSYFVGDIISAKLAPTGINVEDNLIVWADINTAARIWGTPPSVGGIQTINNSGLPNQTIGVSSGGSTVFTTTTPPNWSSLVQYYNGWIVGDGAGSYFKSTAPSLNQTPPNPSFWEDITGDGMLVINIPPGAGAGITSINSDVTTAQSLTVGTAGTDFAIVDSGGGGHVFNLPDASTANRGVVNKTTQSFIGAKTFVNFVTTKEYIVIDNTFGGVGTGTFLLYIDSRSLSPSSSGIIQGRDQFNNLVTGDYSITSPARNSGNTAYTNRANFTIWGSYYDAGLAQTIGDTQPYYAISEGDPIGGILYNGIWATVALAKITPGGTDGSLTVSGGIITGYTPPT